MVEALIDKVQRSNLNLPCLTQIVMAGPKSARTIAGPYTSSINCEQRITLALERGLARNRSHGISSLLKPAAKVLLFPLSFGVEKTAENNDPVALESCIGGKDHVRRTGLGFNKY